MWFVPAILTALFTSLGNVFSKQSLKNIDEYTVAWSLRFFALIFLLIPVLFFVKAPPLNQQFWTALVLGSSLNVMATILAMKAIKASDLSITAPMIAFTPLFLLITSPLMVGEFPNFWGLIGILTVVAGAYTLNIKERRKGFLAPFKALLKEKGPRLMLVVAFIWSITSNFDKIGVKNSSPFIWAFSATVFMAVALLPIMVLKSRRNIRLIPANLKVLVPVGLSNALSLTFEMITLSLTLVAYTYAIKRVSVLITVLFGYFFFKEKGLQERLAGAMIMIVGVLIITLLAK